MVCSIYRTPIFPSGSWCIINTVQSFDSSLVHYKNIIISFPNSFVHSYDLHTSLPFVNLYSLHYRTCFSREKEKTLFLASFELASPNYLGVLPLYYTTGLIPIYYKYLFIIADVFYAKRKEL